MTMPINLGEVTHSPGEYIVHIDSPGKYVVEKTGEGVFGIWGSYPTAEVAAATPPFGRLRVEGTKWGCQMLVPGFYFIRTDGIGSFKMRHWSFSDYLLIKFHGG